MKLIPLFLLIGMLAVSGWAEGYTPEPYSSELVKKAEAGDAKAQFDLGICYQNGLVVTKDNKEALKWYTKAAERGFAEAQCMLGAWYQNGIVVAEDEKEAMKWYTKAGEQGQADAQYSLGIFYENGIGPARNEKEMVKWFTKSAELGHLGGQEYLGTLYYEGKVLPKITKKRLSGLRSQLSREVLTHNIILVVATPRPKGLSKTRAKH